MTSVNRKKRNRLFRTQRGRNEQQKWSRSNRLLPTTWKRVSFNLKSRNLLNVRPRRRPRNKLERVQVLLHSLRLRLLPLIRNPNPFSILPLLRTLLAHVPILPSQTSLILPNLVLSPLLSFPPDLLLDPSDFLSPHPLHLGSIPQNHPPRLPVQSRFKPLLSFKPPLYLYQKIKRMIMMSLLLRKMRRRRRERQRMKELGRISSVLSRNWRGVNGWKRRKARLGKI